MLFSRACEYAIRAMLYVATRPTTTPVPVREIAHKLDIPTPTLAKVIQSLTRPGLLASYKGPGGGVTLAQAAGEVTLLNVVEVIEGPALQTECVLGVPGCSERTTHCPLHEQWGKIREQIMRLLGARSLKDMAGDLKGCDYVLASVRRAGRGSVGRRL